MSEKKQAFLEILNEYFSKNKHGERQESNTDGMEQQESSTEGMKKKVTIQKKQMKTVPD